MTTVASHHDETVLGSVNDLIGHSDHDDSPPLEIAVYFAGQTHVFQLPADAVVDDLTNACEDWWDKKGNDDNNNDTARYDWSTHKFIGPPPLGLLKAADHDRLLAPLVAAVGQNARKKTGDQPASSIVTLRLLASQLFDIQALRAASESVRRNEERRREQLRRQRAGPQARTIRPNVYMSSPFSPPSSPYVFLNLRVLDHMPHADRSLAFLERLRDDVGVRSVMQAHHFTVGLLTEMDPAEHTTATHEGTTRTLGLNRNGGAVIELRLRTDAGDGYRDYRTVRRTLCHELAHNVHSNHDASFWALYRQLEREVERADYHSSGRTLAGDHTTAADYYRPIRNSVQEEEHDSEEEFTDAGGWTGGSFVLGSGAAPAAPALTATVSTASTAESTGSSSTTSRRDLAARAAEERMKRTDERRRESGSDRQ